jgi:hypothetical protein
MNDRESLFDLWALDGATWSPWVKPVLFSEMDESLPLSTAYEERESWDTLGFPSVGSGTALVLELPGKSALRLGVALARRGYRPVPLFNGVPHPDGGFVPSGAIARLLVSLAGELAQSGLPLDAPPAFVLDADRMAGGRVPTPGEFDNRWMVFPQDFPSASFLASHGIRRIVVIQRGTWIADDLVEVLAGHAKGGIEVLVAPPDGGPAQQADLSKASWFRSMFYRAMVVLRLRRSSAGGFGGRVPEPRQSGFYA